MRPISIPLQRKVPALVMVLTILLGSIGLLVLESSSLRSAQSLNEAQAVTVDRTLTGDGYTVSSSPTEIMAVPGQPF